MNNSTTVRSETVKALVIHAAALNSPHHTPDDRRYFGFGVPESPLDTLFCDPDTFTLMFEAELYDGIIWAKTPFPIPACLRPSPDRFRGEVVMTVAYAPPVDGKYGAEYVRANVNASFGSFVPDDDGELHHHGLVPLDTPPNHQDLYEEALIDHGFKWSPIKVYRKRFPRGVLAQTLRLKLELLRRSGETIPVEPQRATVIVSLRGLEPDLPVYNDGLAALRLTNWVAESVTQQTRIQI
jgi:serine protease AprX